jgi:hypothetical protein
MSQAVVAGFSPGRPGFDSSSAHVRFMVDRVTLGSVFVPVLCFFPVSVIRPMRHTTYVSSARCFWQKAKRAKLCRKSGNLDGKVLSLFCL